jgi:[acyl-carrier-protein] S-malonyltransferase
MRAFLFPGQGSQAPGMGRGLSDASAPARRVFDDVDAALGEPLSSLMFEGPAERLTLTENAQPALMAVSIAALRALEDAAGRRLADLAAYVAGHSLGEYSALVAAGSLDLGDGARLLRRRGQAMQAAVPAGEGAMAALLGLELAEIEAVVAGLDAGVCAVANDNAPGQVVISGARPAVERAVAAAKAAGARRSLLLDVSAPFHCPLMAPAAEAMAVALAEVELRAPAVPVVTNVTAGPETDADRVCALLVQQVTGRVRWRESLLALWDLGVREYVELGAGKVLTGLVKRTLPDARALALQTPDDIAGFVEAA